MAGLAAAITAARAGAKTTLFEERGRVGQKILATGNGKCNLGNTAKEPWLKYNNPGFVRSILSEYGVNAAFWRSVGVKLFEADKRLYPHSLQASQVLNALRSAAESAGVETVTASGVSDKDIAPNGKEGYLVFSRPFKKLILASGSGAGIGCESYFAAMKFGHALMPVYPILGPLITDKSTLKGLKGVRLPAHVRAKADGKTVAEASGEVIFKDNGVSGTAVFDLSVFLGRLGYPAADLYFDFVPELTPEELKEELKEFPVESFVHKELARNILSMGNPEKLLKAYPVYRAKAGSMELAQAATGGLRTDEFSDMTLESKLSPGFFAAGEVLDVDGECGGFNLMWATASGQAAAKGALSGL